MTSNNNQKAPVFDRIVRLIQTIPDSQEQTRVTALLLALSAPQLSAQQTQQLKEALKMNPLVREIEQEATEKTQQAIAREMLKMGFTPQQIAEATKLSLEKIAALQHSSPS